MVKYEIVIEGVSPYSQSRGHTTPMLEKESHDAYEERTWRNRLHVDRDGHVVIPPMSFKVCLSEAAKFLGIQQPGKGKATYTKHFEAGIMVVDPARLDVRADDVMGERLFVPSDGKRGGGKRVWRTFPLIPAGWRATFPVYVLDAVITEKVLIRHVAEAGSLIGLGRFRPRNNGFYGRFRMLDIQQMAEAA